MYVDEPEEKNFKSIILRNMENDLLVLTFKVQNFKSKFSSAGFCQKNDKYILNTVNVYTMVRGSNTAAPFCRKEGILGKRKHLNETKMKFTFCKL